jgi:hypothetical protein
MNTLDTVCALLSQSAYQQSTSSQNSLPPG